MRPSIPLEQLPADVRAQVLAGETSTRRRPKDRSHESERGMVLVCHTCAERLVGPAAHSRHLTATGHTRYEIPLEGS